MSGSLGTSDILVFIGLIIDNVFSLPVAIFLTVLLLRKPIAAMLGRLETFKHGNVEIRLLKEIDGVRTQAEKMRKEKEVYVEGDKPDSPFMMGIKAIANISPLAAIPYAYAQVESALKMRGPPYNDKGSGSFHDFPKYLYEHDLIDTQSLDMFISMRAISAAVLYDKTGIREIERGQVLAYARAAETLLKLLDSIPEEALA